MEADTYAFIQTALIILVCLASVATLYALLSPLLEGGGPEKTYECCCE